MPDTQSPDPALGGPIAHGPIQHVVVLMMENACFDRMLGCMRETHPDLDGVDPNRPFTNPDPDSGKPIAQAPTEQRNIDRDPKHALHNSLAQYASGTNQGFVADFVHTHPNSTPEERCEVMGFYPRGFLPALHTLAENFTVCDRWFASVPGPTWMNRLFAHTGTSMGHVSEPNSLFSTKLHLYDERTLYDELSDAEVPWRIYFGDVPQSLVLSHQFEHLGHYRRYKHFSDDVAAGDLPGYSFIEPTYFGPNQNDQHPPQDVRRGDALIADVYNTLRSNPDLFARTLLIVVYDEHGGFCDHVVPPRTVAPDDHTQHFDFDLLGFRVPAVLVSPLLDAGVVSTVFDHTSLLRMAANLWGVEPLGRRAAQANDPVEAVRWRATPRTDLPEAPVASDIQDVRRLPTLDSGLKASLFGLTHQLESLIADAGRRGALMARAHEALSDAWDQAKLATDRVDAFFEERTAENAAGWVGRAVEEVRHRIGL